MVAAPSACVPQYPTITKQRGIIILGANDLSAGTSASTFLSRCETIADSYLSLYGSRPFIVVPISRGDSDPGARETRRRDYRTALLTSSKFAGIIDTDSREPGVLTALENSAYSCAECVGGMAFMQPTLAANNIALPGTLALNSKNVGSDGAHMGPMGHQAMANMLLSDTASGLAQELGSIPQLASSFFGRTNRIGRGT